MTEKESIALISEMIARTKERYIGDGNILLLWGYLTVAVTLLVWLLLTITHQGVWNFLWFHIWIIGGIATPIMAKKQLKKNGVKNYSDKITSKIWNVVGISAAVASLICLGFQIFGDI